MDGARDIDRDIRELALVDRILGLEAQLAQVSAFMNPARNEVVALENRVAGLEQQLAGLQATATWKAGRLALAPARAIRRLRSR